MPEFSARRRSIAKAITFRILILCSDAIVVYAITRRVDTTTYVTVATNVVSTLLYFGHERLWNKVAWGRTASR